MTKARVTSLKSYEGDHLDQCAHLGLLSVIE